MKRLLLIASILTLLSCSSSGAEEKSTPAPSKSESPVEPISLVNSVLSSEEESSKEISSEEESADVIISSSYVSSIASSSEETKTKLEAINDLLNRDYSSGRFISTVSKDGMTLNSTFLVQVTGDAVEVEYQVERYSLLDIDNPISLGEKTVIEGKIEWKNGNKKVISGEDIAIDIGQFTLSSYALEESDIEEEESGAGSYSASLVDPQTYLGINKPIHDFKITFLYDERRIVRLEYSYTDAEGYLISLYFDNLA